MGFFDDLVKTALPIAAGAFLGPAASPLFAGATGIMANPAVQSALLSGGLGLLSGQRPKDALKSALLGGIGGYAGQKFSAAGAPATTGGSPYSSYSQLTGSPQAPSAPPPVTPPPVKGIEPKTMSAELLKGIGLSGDPGQENLLFKILNTRAGEGLLAGLGAYGLDALMGDDEEQDNRGSFERRPFGAGGPGGKLGGINYADGGEAYFPRRNGGIDPSEGSGRKDDVPAMLMAGEFVMTRDAVKGAGNGNLRQGINNMYNMMDQFERMA